MKKILVLITIFCFSAFVVSNAQTNKGRIMVGASSTVNLGVSDTEYVNNAGVESDSYKSTYLNISPKVGYFVIDNLAVGADIYISSNTNKYSDNTKYITRQLSFGPFGRYYFPMDKFMPFVELNSSFGTRKTKNVTNIPANNNERKAGIISFGAYAGVAMPLGDRVTFDVMAGYNHITYTNKYVSETGGSSSTTKDKTGTIGLELGFVVFFNSK
jgi:outer membrane protein